MAQLEAAVMGAGALGGKAAGSGAGGCMFFLCRDEPGRAIAAAQSMGAEILPVRWAGQGVRLC
jgi:mevalonate kinase